MLWSRAGSMDAAPKPIYTTEREARFVHAEYSVRVGDISSLQEIKECVTHEYSSHLLRNIFG